MRRKIDAMIELEEYEREEYGFLDGLVDCGKCRVERGR